MLQVKTIRFLNANSFPFCRSKLIPDKVTCNIKHRPVTTNDPLNELEVPFKEVELHFYLDQYLVQQYTLPRRQIHAKESKKQNIARHLIC